MYPKTFVIERENDAKTVFTFVSEYIAGSFQPVWFCHLNLDKYVVLVREGAEWRALLKGLTKTYEGHGKRMHDALADLVLSRPDAGWPSIKIAVRPFAAVV